MLAKATCGNIVKKYRLQRLAQKALSFLKRRALMNWDLCSFQWKKRNRVAQECKQSIAVFYLRDNVSRMTTGSHTQEGKYAKEVVM